MPTEKHAVQRWMRDVMERRDWSAERWARLSETSPTNITRFLRDMDLRGDSEFLPSSRTIAKLARTAGSQPAFGRELSRLSQIKDVPILDDLSWLIAGTPMPRSVSTVKNVGDVSDVAFAWKVPARTVTPEIREGDVLILEPCSHLAPRDGDWVIYDDQHEPSIGRFVNGAIFNGRSEVVRADPKAVVVSLQRALR